MVIKTASEHGVTTAIAPDWKINIRETESGWTCRLDYNHADLIYDLGTYKSKDEAQPEAEKKARTIVPGHEQVASPLQWAAFSKETKVTERKATARQQIFAVFGLFVGLLAALVALTVSFPGPSLTTQADTQKREIGELRKLVEAERTDIDGMRKMPIAGSSEVNQRLAQLENAMAGLKEKLGNYEAAIGDEPAKKLAVPMLRKDMETLREEHQSDLTAIHNEMSRTFDLMKWLLGLLGAGSVISSIGSWVSRSNKNA